MKIFCGLIVLSEAIQRYPQDRQLPNLDERLLEIDIASHGYAPKAVKKCGIRYMGPSFYVKWKTGKADDGEGNCIDPEVDYAKENGLEQVDNTVFDTEFRKQALDKAKARMQQVSSGYGSQQGNERFGTVGAVVLDQEGNIVAGTSTGGMTAKRYGRIGDSPVIGAGTYADNGSCAVSATGHGEYFIRYNVAADICARMKYQGLTLNDAANTVVNDVLVKAGGDGGVIAIDAKGNVAMPFNSAGMYRASVDINGKVKVAIYKD